MTGLFLLALGSSIMITANLGVSTWDVLHIGIAHHLPISIGTVILCVGLLLVLFKYILDRIRPQFGT
ncbi:MAG: membrane protein, partial [Exiguobacterium marinum]